MLQDRALPSRAGEGLAFGPRTSQTRLRAILNFSGQTHTQSKQLLNVAVAARFSVNPQNGLGPGAANHQPRRVFCNEFDSVVTLNCFQGGAQQLLWRMAFQV